MTAPIAVIMRREREVVTAFRVAGATSPVHALPLHSLSVDDGIGFRRLFARAVIREAHPGAFYLDEGVLTAVRASRRRVMLIVTGVLAIIVMSLALRAIPLT